MRDIIKKLPKRRGYGKNRGRSVDGTIPDAVAVSVERLSQVFENGAEVTMKSLAAVGISHMRKMTPVKIVGNGEITKKLTINGIAVSAGARAAIEKAGGSIVDFVSAAEAQGARIKKNKVANKIAAAEVKKSDAKEVKKS